LATLPWFIHRLTKAFAADSAGDDGMRSPLLYRVP
jgi:hypothetical protein